jgi:hypothetical protein
MILPEKNCQVASLIFLYPSPGVNDCELRQITGFHLLSWCSETGLRQLARPTPRNRNNIQNDIMPSMRLPASVKLVLRWRHVCLNCGGF